MIVSVGYMMSYTAPSETKWDLWESVTYNLFTQERKALGQVGIVSEYFSRFVTYGSSRARAIYEAI